MPDTVRELIAYSIIAVMALAAAGYYFGTRKSRREQALRRRGIKSHNRIA